MSYEVKREKCVSCGERLPADIVDIGSQYPSAVFLSDSDRAPPELHSTSLNVTRCQNQTCTLIQLAYEYDLQYVFDHYPYESGSTATMKEILQDVVTDAESVVDLTPNDIVLDIGGNDGTMLGLFTKPLKCRVNIDAAAGIKQTVLDDNYHHVRAQFEAESYSKLGLPSPKLITSVAMFYHLSNPLEFCENISKVMNDDSVWILQMTYVGTMLEDNIFDNIVHEHVAYYSLFSIEALLAKVGLTVAEARIVPSYGGSLRIFIVKDPSKFPSEYWRKDYLGVQQFEIDHSTNSYEALYAFDSRCRLLRDSLRQVITHITEKNELIWGFGASTKGNMILQYLGIDEKTLPFILDNSGKKIGTRTTGSLVPIIDEESNIKNVPEYLLVLPYYYTNAFVKILKKKLPVGKKVHLIIPLPYPKFITVIGEGHVSE